MLRRLDLALLPAEADAIEADCYCVVDVLRATTTIAVLFHAGLRRLTCADDEAAARALAAERGALLFGEVGGLPPQGFDFGNSPVEALDAPVSEREAVLFTTNGTRALCALAGRGAVVTGALANASAVATELARHQRVAIVCAGNAAGLRFALEDFAAAAALVQSALKLAPGAEVGDAAALAAETARYDDWLRAGLPQRTEASGRLIGGSEHARRLAVLGLSADIRFAAERDTAPVVPRVVEAGPGRAVLEAKGARHEA